MSFSNMTDSEDTLYHDVVILVHSMPIVYMQQTKGVMCFNVASKLLIELDAVSIFAAFLTLF